MKKLPDDASRGRFISGMCGRVFDGKAPDFSDDPLVDILYTSVADQVEESIAMYEKAAEGGKKSGQKRREKKNEGGSEPPSEGGSEGGSERKVRYSKVPYSGAAATALPQPRPTLTDEQMAELARLGESQTNPPSRC